MNIRLLRLKQSMSQEALAKVLGVSFQQIQKYEKGANRLNGEKLEQVANVFGVTIQTLISGNGNYNEIQGNTAPPVIDRQAFMFMESFRSIEPRFRTILSSLVEELKKRNPTPSM